MTSAAVSEPSSRMSFKPTWMGAGQRGGYAKPGTGTYIQRTGQQSNGDPTQLLNSFGHGVTTIGAPTDTKDMAKPKMARNRFSREELLAIYQSQSIDDETPPPYFDSFAEFVINEPQMPISLTQMSEYEERTFHQMGINSSKSLSALSNETRNALGIPQSAPGFTPSWAQGDRATAMRGGYNVRGGRGGVIDVRGGRGGYAGARGRGSMATLSARNGESDQSNLRAQGLYDPRDPRDRPRTRENGDIPPTRGGWSRGGGTYGYSAHNEHPAWLDDDDEEEYDENNIDGEHILRADRNSDDTRKKSDVGVKDILADLFDKNQTVNNTKGQVPAKETAEPKIPTLQEIEKQKPKPNVGSKRSVSPDDFKHMHLLGESLINSFGLEDDGNEGVRHKISEKAQQINTERLNPAVQQLMKFDAESQHPKSIPLSFLFDQQKPTHKENEENIPNTVSDILTHAANIVVQQRSQQQQQAVASTAVANSSPPIVHKTNKPATYSSTDQWYYIDPKGVQQGPFPSEQMQTWCKAGYFALELKLRRSTDPESALVPLATIMQMNNGRAPFVCAKDENMHSDAAKLIAKHQENGSAAAQAREADKERIRREVEQRRQQLAEEKEQQQKKQKQVEEEQRYLQQMKAEQEALARQQTEDERMKREEQQKQAYVQAMQQGHYQKQQLAMQKAAEEETQRRKLLDQQLRQQQQMTQQQVREPYAPPSGRTIQLSELFGMPFATRPKWTTPSAWAQMPAQQATDMARTIQEIQEEEERKEATRREDINRLQAMRNQQSAQQQVSGAWSQVAAKHSQPVSQQLLQQQQRQGTVGWGTPASGNAIGMWDTEGSKKGGKGPQTATTSMTMKQLEEQFKQWVIAQCRILDASVDADMFAQFLQGIDDPAEVEDYLFTYFKNDDRTREFKSVYLKRRSEHRLLKNQRQERDDLTTASAAIHHAHDSGSNLNALLIAQQAKQAPTDAKSPKLAATKKKPTDSNQDSDSDFQIVGKGNKKNKKGKK